jgi:hypothetical protein
MGSSSGHEGGYRATTAKKGGRVKGEEQEGKHEGRRLFLCSHLILPVLVQTAKYRLISTYISFNIVTDSHLVPGVTGSSLFADFCMRPFPAQ